ncbi:MAG: hypothetical protein PHQ04_10920 [Opitutaceae bacterium]|nr:hypothetical protein [Opitutaceae bacterium]
MLSKKISTMIAAGAFIVSAFAGPDHALRDLLNVGSLEISLPSEEAASREVACLIYINGERQKDLILKIPSHVNKAQVVWREDGEKTHIVLLAGGAVVRESINVTVSQILTGGRSSDIPFKTTDDGWLIKSFWVPLTIVNNKFVRNTGIPVFLENYPYALELAYRNTNP